MAENKTRKRMNKKEKHDFDELCEYVRSNIMEYDNDVDLTKAMKDRLKNFSKSKDTEEYLFSIVLDTFKYRDQDIKRALSRVSFKSEKGKLNYILKIVEESLDIVRVRVKNREESKEKSKTINMDVHTYKGAEYKVVKHRLTSKVQDLWNEVLR